MTKERISPLDPDREIKKWEMDWEAVKEVWPVLKWTLIIPAAAVVADVIGMCLGWW